MLAPPPKLPKLIAVVEDDKAVLASLQFALQADGYDVCGFERATEARDSDEILSADCLVLDYGMPDLSGVALLNALRGKGLRSPAIIIASNPTARCRQESRDAGVPLVEKPLMGAELGDRIRAALDVTP
jgi:DNA-binding response OmpR family regulator